MTHKLRLRWPTHQEWLTIGLAAALAAALLAPRLLSPPGSAFTTPTRTYYHQTAHSVEDPFATFYFAHGGPAIFGYPLTEAHVDAGGTTVQYFTRARLELTGEGAVVAGNLVAELKLYSASAPAQSGTASERGRWFPRTGHSSGDAFLAFFDAHGGEEVFGGPISDVTLIGGRLTQYFEKAVFTWWPENPPEHRVVLLEIGYAAIKDPTRVPPAWLTPVPDSAGRAADPAPTTLQIIIGLEKPTLRLGETQTISVYVLDQFGRPVQGARVRVAEARPGARAYEGLPTSAKGLAILTYVPQGTHGERVPVRVSAAWGSQTSEAQTSYLIWP